MHSPISYSSCSSKIQVQPSSSVIATAVVKFKCIVLIISYSYQYHSSKTMYGLYISYSYHRSTEVVKFKCILLIISYGYCSSKIQMHSSLHNCSSHSRKNIFKLGRTSLSLVLGNMVVARQILLIFNLSYLPCSVQFVNKNYCHAKNDLFTTCWCHYFVREWCIVSLEEVLMNTPSGRKPSVVLTSKVRWARSENLWELLQEKCTDVKLYFLERGIPVDLSIIKFVKIRRFRLQQKLSWKIRSFLP